MLAITYLRRAVSAETLKLKRTLAVWMVFVAPSVVVALNFVMLLDRGENFMLQRDSAWQALAQNVLLFWALLMLPLFVTLETALLGGVDHGSQQWKHLYALPIPGWAIYMAKLLIALLLIGASTLALWLETIVSGLLLGALKPQLGFSAPVPAWEMLQAMLLTFLIAWCIIAVHQFVALRWQSFTFAIGFGIATAVINFMVIQSDKWSRYFPWSWPGYAIVKEGADFRPVALLLGLAGGVLVGLIGMWIVARREVV